MRFDVISAKKRSTAARQTMLASLRGDVQPRRAGRCEMQLEARVFLQPGLDCGRLVRGVVVEDEVYVAGLFHRPVNAAQEAQEFLRPLSCI